MGNPVYVADARIYAFGSRSIYYGNAASLPPLPVGHPNKVKHVYYAHSKYAVSLMRNVVYLRVCWRARKRNALVCGYMLCCGSIELPTQLVVIELGAAMGHSRPQTRTPPLTPTHSPELSQFNERTTSVGRNHAHTILKTLQSNQPYRAMHTTLKMPQPLHKSGVWFPLWVFLLRCVCAVLCILGQLSSSSRCALWETRHCAIKRAERGVFFVCYRASTQACVRVCSV